MTNFWTVLSLLPLFQWKQAMSSIVQQQLRDYITTPFGLLQRF
ncbi:MAG: integrase, partial [Oxalobacteraceae bacterium]